MAATVQDRRKLLVERIAASRYFSRSARLRDLLVYLCDRVVEGEAAEIHEQEVGNRVFGRPPDYDTVSDNIVRVHASMLRKRLEQYFSTEGADERIIIEIPKGNYAPVFRERSEATEAPAATPEVERARDWRVPALAAAVLLLAGSTMFLLLPRISPAGGLGAGPGPTVRQFWSQIFRPNQTTDLVLDDAAVGLYQELTGRTLALSDYFDRGYLRTLRDTAAGAKLDEQAAGAMVLRRQASYSSTSFLWRMARLSGADLTRANLQFARDYSFHALKTDNAVLIGSRHSNPWMEPFEAGMGLRWVYDKAGNLYYPEDQRTAKSYRPAEAGEAREGYAVVALMPNLGGTGTVLLVSATGGSAMNSTADFLTDEQALHQLQRVLGSGGRFPSFEALLRLKGRSTRPRDTEIVVSRTLGR